MDQPKLERALRFMKLLTGNRYYTVKELSRQMGLTRKSIYRYIDTFSNEGFIIKKIDNIYRIDKATPYFKEITELIMFTDLEASLLKKAIESIHENNVLKEHLKKKLSTVYDYKLLADVVVKENNTRIISRLTEALNNQKQVILHNYSSANSHEVRDRIVEAFSFTTNYIQIWAYEPESKLNKLFKIARIADVTLLNAFWENEVDHRKDFIDIFRISSPNRFPVKLRLGLQAANLLMEEYPLSENCLTKITDNEWIFETEVCSFDGVGRFAMGLLHDIDILESSAFRDFLKKRADFFQKKLSVSQVDTL